MKKKCKNRKRINNKNRNKPFQQKHFEKETKYLYFAQLFYFMIFTVSHIEHSKYLLLHILLPDEQICRRISPRFDNDLSNQLELANIYIFVSLCSEMNFDIR